MLQPLFVASSMETYLPYQRKLVSRAFPCWLQVWVQTNSPDEVSEKNASPPKIFRPFFMASKMTQGMMAGAPLGLPVTRRWRKT